ncbi:DUF4129 domain-containing protein [Cellulomonas gilvus]|uniref:Protein-glutamine gamma-glutamyltransferase-like C-terminal domain-containing protein n=1 Tax=Cellulomonas gilvus (strain ATCC 13127 / NRRL B-14078) TaxID=593907 RepID=F8A7Q6_CELGA|nr:DUF4129 domain-containing protein [Cellulomonas gilvus]AEI13589.1 hypothetical protein Celgi_3098 [Cellulomonas gilvus ATCC 13127]
MARQDARRAALVSGALVAVAVLAAALAGPWRPEQRPGSGIDIGLDLPVPTPPPRPEETAQPIAEAAGGMPQWVGYALFALLLLILAVLGPRLVRAVRRWAIARRPPLVDDTDPGEVLHGEVGVLARPALVRGVEAAVLELDRDVPPGDAVVAAWVALEHAAERSGVLREPAQTASEFTLELLDATEADGEASRALLALYLAARFSEHRLTADDVAQARSALDVVARGVGHLRHDDPPARDAS